MRNNQTKSIPGFKELEKQIKATKTRLFNLENQLATVAKSRYRPLPGSDAEYLYGLIGKKPISGSQLAKTSGFDEAKVRGILSSLMKQHVVKRSRTRMNVGSERPQYTYTR